VNTVDIRARVSGYLEEVPFKDGEVISKDDLLAHIDDRSFKAELARAKAAIAQFQARFSKLEKQEARAAQLLQSNTRAITQEEFDAIVADKEEAAASIDAAIAAKDIAELNLSYTQVKSPISGRISRRLVDPGNLVTADSTIIATIVTVDPIYVYFDMDERTVLRMKRLVREGKIRSTRESKLQVQISLADETAFDHVGVVDFVDNQLDPATGTLRFRAEV
jgi:RND family efflux transporter MFP subunit